MCVPGERSDQLFLKKASVRVGFTPGTHIPTFLYSMSTKSMNF